MMAMPMILLYNMSILMAWRVTLRREAKDKLLQEQEAIEDEKERQRLRDKRARGEQVDEDDDD